MKVYHPRSWLELMQAAEYTFGIFYKKMFDNLSAISVLPGPFSLYKREVFAKVGMFKHAHNTEDMEIAFRMHARHLKIANAHTAYVYTTVPKTALSLIRQRTRWSQGFLQNSRDYSYMYFNRTFGNFGMAILPFNLIGFFAALYTACYSLYRAADFVISYAADRTATGVPFHLPNLLHVQLLYVDTSMMLVVVMVVLCMTFVAIFLGGRIAQTHVTFKAVVSYFLLYGFIAPLWLIKAAWGAALARESVWR
jgi:cellulose synthase/poly-beta-1,6-N-acetylglucosamine synthase-like glycosyltransferase